MFRRFLRHKVIRDKDLLLIFPKPPYFPRLLSGTFVGNVVLGFIRLVFQSSVASSVPSFSSEARAALSGLRLLRIGIASWKPPSLTGAGDSQTLRTWDYHYSRKGQVVGCTQATRVLVVTTETYLDTYHV